MEEFGDDLKEFERKIGVTPGFYKKLINEDDWSFIIKLHALLEAATTHLLVFHFQESNLRKVISRLDMSNNQTGKLAFLKELEMISKRSRRYIRSLSEIRNSLVHDIRKVEFTLNEYISDYTQQEITRFAKTFSPFEALSIELKDSKIFGEEIDTDLTINMLKDRVKNDPKEYIWFGGHSILVNIMDNHLYSDYLNWQKGKEFE
ncbi:hypothetical protein [Gracilimonas sp.]|uniref:hypothetical protein n=1 Tax=Gracilimonas sp. TaxID=1974203 RepID=UPI003D0DAEE7